MRDLVTVVIPVYNVEKYIYECVNSVLDQEYKDIEIILVDDGSTDSSGKKCDEIASSDNRIKVIHQENKGLSGARNAAIDIAKGTYITFVDSDDFINRDMISRMLSLLKSNDADMVVTGLRSFFEDGSEIMNSHKGKVFVYSKEKALDCYLFNNYLTPCVCGKLYKLELWNDIRCPIGKLHEDQYTTYKIIDKCNTIVYDTDCQYNYRKRLGSIGHSNFSTKSYDLLYGIREEYDYITKKYKDDCPNIYVARITWEVVFFNMMINSGKIDEIVLKEVRGFAKKNFVKVIKCPYIDKVRKIQILLFIINIRLYKKIYLSYKIHNPLS